MARSKARVENHDPRGIGQGTLNPGNLLDLDAEDFLGEGQTRKKIDTANVPVPKQVVGNRPVTTDTAQREVGLLYLVEDNAATSLQPFGESVES